MVPNQVCIMLCKHGKRVCINVNKNFNFEIFENDELLNFCLDLRLHDYQARPPAKRQQFDTSKEEELDQLLDGTTAKSTKYATIYAGTIFC